MVGKAHRGSVRGAGTNPELDCEQEIKRLEQINIEKDLVIAEKEYPTKSSRLVKLVLLSQLKFTSIEAHTF